MKIKKCFLQFSFSVLVGLILSNCSDLREPISTNPVAELEVHPAEWLVETSQDFHGQFIQNAGWNLEQCQQCHGTDYTGGIAKTSCLTCHPQTPEDCTVCHGGVDNLTGAPPEDLAGSQTTDSRGVGAHTTHLNGAALSVGFECGTCHVVPASFNTPGHVDSELPAEVRFSGSALLDNAVPNWDTASGSCMNAYCHGNWSLSKMESNNQFIYSADNMEGNNATPTWTDPATAVCGTCHDLPPRGHTPFELNACAGCHSSVIDANGDIIDKTKHVNGQINVFGQEFSISSPAGTEVHPADWLVASSPDFHGRFIRNSGWDLRNCQQCHGVDYAGGIVNTSCLTCHPQTPEDCIVCHGGGDNVTGAPPEDLAGNQTNDARGVGAHTIHLAGNILSFGFECGTCHVVPGSFDAPGHADTELPAELVFSGMALIDDAQPAWDTGTLSCASSYCHGNWSLTKTESNNQFVYTADNLEGNNATPTWTEPVTAVCGTCHALPPRGHMSFELNACVGCHSSVIDANGNIVDKTKHVNGQINVFGQEAPISSPADLAVHPARWLDASSSDFHGRFIQDSGWDLGNCQQCHGSDYAGGIVNTSCLTCHPATPEDCVVCHGGVDNITGAPPEDLNGNQSSDARGVGAHTTHLAGNAFSFGFECGTCHVVPESFDAPSHIDTELPAEVLFSGLALTDSAAPNWDTTSESCMNAYCHGNWSLAKVESNNQFIYSADNMEGNHSTPTWTAPATVACGTCHDLPPVGHNPFDLAACVGCHSSVIDVSGKIIDKSKHVNGQVNVFGQEFPMF